MLSFNTIIKNIPNALSVLRVVLSPICFALLLSAAAFTLPMKLALLFFSVASISDFFDGYIARRYQNTSMFGSIIDPVADKILLCSSLLPLCIEHHVPAWIVYILLSRELFINAIRLIAAQNSIKISSSNLGKLKTLLLGLALFLYILGLSFSFLHIFQTIGLWTLYAALAASLISAADYCLKFNKSLAMRHV